MVKDGEQITEIVDFKSSEGNLQDSQQDLPSAWHWQSLMQAPSFIESEALPSLENECSNVSYTISTARASNPCGLWLHGGISS